MIGRRIEIADAEVSNAPRGLQEELKKVPLSKFPVNINRHLEWDFPKNMFQEKQLQPNVSLNSNRLKKFPRRKLSQQSKDWK